MRKLSQYYLLLRFVIGAMGVALPIILVLGTAIFSNCVAIQPSISHYYYTNMGNVFVAYVFCLSVFLLSYPGYDKDHIFSKLAFLFGITFAFLPTVNKPASCQECHVVFPWNPGLIGSIHLTAASLFILVLAIYSYFLFTKTDEVHNPGRQNKRKHKRNYVYRVCGIVMFAVLVLLGMLFLLADYFKLPFAIDLLNNHNTIFWGEVVALEAFGLSWFVKGGALLRDIGDPGPIPLVKKVALGTHLDCDEKR